MADAKLTLADQVMINACGTICTAIADEAGLRLALEILCDVRERVSEHPKLEELRKAVDAVLRLEPPARLRDARCLLLFPVSDVFRWRMAVAYDVLAMRS